MEDPPGYRWYFCESRLEEARLVVWLLGMVRYEKTDPTIKGRLDAIDDFDHLKRLIDRVLVAKGWEDLLADHGPGPVTP